MGDASLAVGRVQEHVRERPVGQVPLAEHRDLGVEVGANSAVTAYRDLDRRRGRERLHDIITSSSAGVPAALTELVTLGGIRAR